ncbi:MAG: class I SAM-dependent methyltransferase [Promethearchaeota archaeon]
MPTKDFYDKTKVFSGRTMVEYYISPGIKCKFDTILDRLGRQREFKRVLDIGCSGDSILYFLERARFKSFVDLAHKPLTSYRAYGETYGPTCGSITDLPYPDGTFDLVCGLDVLEHIRDDERAVAEMVRVLERGGLMLVTVPHRMKYFTPQDTLVGHYRRYEYDQIRGMVEAHPSMRTLVVFPVYGQMMRIGAVQQANPDATEEGLDKLRENYESNPVFKKFWDIIVKVGARMMWMDAQYRKLERTLDICVIFKKVKH